MAPADACLVRALGSSVGAVVRYHRLSAEPSRCSEDTGRKNAGEPHTAPAPYTTTGKCPGTRGVSATSLAGHSSTHHPHRRKPPSTVGGRQCTPTRTLANHLRHPK